MKYGWNFCVFWHDSAKIICKTGSKECVVWTSGCEKKHVTVFLSATADGKVLPPMIIFKGSTEKTIQKLRVPEGFVIKKWREGVDRWSAYAHLSGGYLVKHTKRMSEKLAFENMLLTFDAFPVHKTDEIQGKLIEKKTYFDDSAWLHFKMPADGCLY